MKDKYGYHGGIRQKGPGNYVENPKSFFKVPHKQARIRFALDNITWQRLRGKHPTFPKEAQG